MNFAGRGVDYGGVWVFLGGGGWGGLVFWRSKVRWGVWCLLGGWGVGPGRWLMFLGEGWFVWSGVGGGVCFCSGYLGWLFCAFRAWGVRGVGGCDPSTVSISFSPPALKYFGAGARSPLFFF